MVINADPLPELTSSRTALINVVVAPDVWLAVAVVSAAVGCATT